MKRDLLFVCLICACGLGSCGLGPGRGLGQRAGGEEVEVKGCPPRPSLPQTPSLGMALERGIWAVVSFFVSLLILFLSFSLVKFFFRWFLIAAYK